MNARQVSRIISATLAALAWASLAAAQQPGYPKAPGTGPHNLAAVNAGADGFLGLALATEREGRNNRPVVSYGVHQFNNKPRYTYFIIFKTDRAKKWEVGTGVGLGDPDDL